MNGVKGVIRRREGERRWEGEGVGGTDIKEGEGVGGRDIKMGEKERIRRTRKAKYEGRGRENLREEDRGGEEGAEERRQEDPFPGRQEYERTCQALPRIPTAPRHLLLTCTKPFLVLVIPYGGAPTCT